MLIFTTPSVLCEEMDLGFSKTAQLISKMNRKTY